ncbi:MAG: hypothetical protein HYZ73_00730 [Elusimicrobia bacterium]|nr:hypothetical protein [Elusimicrobiota bacterium]
MISFCLGVTGVCWPAVVLAQGCALCRQALASGGGQGLLKGFYWSIILLTTVPLLLIVGIAGILFYSYRAQLKRQQPSRSLR